MLYVGLSNLIVHTTKGRHSKDAALFLFHSLFIIRMTARDKMILCSFVKAECELNNPVFIWNGQVYPCVASDPVESDIFAEGGDAKELAVTMTVRKFNPDGSSLFANNIYPSVNDTFLHSGYSFRVATFSPGVLGLTFNLTGISDSQGN